MSSPTRNQKSKSTPKSRKRREALVAAPGEALVEQAPLTDAGEDAPLASPAETSPNSANMSDNESSAEVASVAGDWQSPPWAEIAKRIVKRFERRRLSKLFRVGDLSGKATSPAALLGGLAVAQCEPVSPRQRMLAELAWGERPKGNSVFRGSWADAVAEFLVAVTSPVSAEGLDLQILADAVLWAHALPALMEDLSESQWKSLCQSLDSLARDGLAVRDPLSIERLIAGELALVLRFRLEDLASDSLAASAVDALEAWLDGGEDAVAAALCEAGREARLVIASVLRQRALAKATLDRKVKRKQLGVAIDLACWVAAMTRRDGTPVFSWLAKNGVRDDVAPGGLFDAMKSLAPELLGPAVDATLGRGHSDGKLSWAVSLPESLWFSEAARIGAMLTEWDVRRGRVYVDYSADTFQLEIEYGRGVAVLGCWDVKVEVDGGEQSPAEPWALTCEYTDDDVHYLEFEQHWTGEVKVQRQLLVLREDRCVLLADAVIRSADRPSARIACWSRVPIDTALTVRSQAETNELWLEDAAGRRRGLALSLQTHEWRIGRSAVGLEVDPENRLLLLATSQPPSDNGGGVYLPLWFDFQPRRFERPRTYRRLTVGDALRVVDADEAVAHRIQMGSEQWLVYRSLRGERNRTYLGKHLIADFQCGRFHPGDGSIEDLVTITSHDHGTDAESAAD